MARAVARAEHAHHDERRLDGLDEARTRVADLGVEVDVLAGQVAGAVDVERRRHLARHAERDGAEQPLAGGARDGLRERRLSGQVEPAQHEERLARDERAQAEALVLAQRRLDDVRDAAVLADERRRQRVGQAVLEREAVAAGVEARRRRAVRRAQDVDGAVDVDLVRLVDGRLRLARLFPRDVRLALDVHHDRLHLDGAVQVEHHVAAQHLARRVLVLLVDVMLEVDVELLHLTHRREVSREVARSLGKSRGLSASREFSRQVAGSRRSQDLGFRKSQDLGNRKISEIARSRKSHDLKNPQDLRKRKISETGAQSSRFASPSRRRRTRT